MLLSLVELSLNVSSPFFGRQFTKSQRSLLFLVVNASIVGHLMGGRERKGMVMITMPIFVLVHDASRRSPIVSPPQRLFGHDVVALLLRLRSSTYPPTFHQNLTSIISLSPVLLFQKKGFVKSVTNSLTAPPVNFRCASRDLEMMLLDLRD